MIPSWTVYSMIFLKTFLFKLLNWRNNVIEAIPGEKR